MAAFHAVLARPFRLIFTVHVLHLLSWRGIGTGSSFFCFLTVVDDERDELDREPDAIITTRVYMVRRSLGAGGGIGWAEHRTPLNKNVGFGSI